MNEARAPTDEKLKEKVLAEYRKGVKPKALSKKFGISINTIKSWINRDKSKNAEPVAAAPCKKEGAPPEKKKGAPLKNKNAMGAGAPEGNKNALKHGGYSAIYWDTLDDEEREMIEEIPTDEETLLIEQIQLFAIRERKLMKAIHKYRRIEDGPKGNLALAAAITNENKKRFANSEDKERYEKLRQDKIDDDKISYLYEEYNVTTTTEATINIIQRLDRELTSVQAKKTKTIETLSRLHLEKQKLTGSSAGNEVVRTWAEKVLAERGKQ